MKLTIFRKKKIISTFCPVYLIIDGIKENKIELHSGDIKTFHVDSGKHHISLFWINHITHLVNVTHHIFENIENNLMIHIENSFTLKHGTMFDLKILD